MQKLRRSSAKTTGISRRALGGREVLASPHTDPGQMFIESHASTIDSTYGAGGADADGSLTEPAQGRGGSSSAADPRGRTQTVVPCGQLMEVGDFPWCLNWKPRFVSMGGRFGLNLPTLGEAT